MRQSVDLCHISDINLIENDVAAIEKDTPAVDIDVAVREKNILAVKTVVAVREKDIPIVETVVAVREKDNDTDFVDVQGGTTAEDPWLMPQATLEAFLVMWVLSLTLTKEDPISTSATSEDVNLPLIAKDDTMAKATENDAL
ncbi:CRISPR-associated helicase Cas3 [Corchorus olitorius]|uniref:CRISPR-associated helicase Cas3 n=1 Tax=Corchorus olitorius TaxID=93759 RepID=A0A1R3K984_9ROSI|nr:CRISPR-associated helicase Cas3 [Corchorus olitorius]